MDLGEAIGWIGDPDGQGEVYEAEAIAKLAGAACFDRLPQEFGQLS